VSLLLDLRSLSRRSASIFTAIERGLARWLRDERRAADAASVETPSRLAQISIRVLRDIGQSDPAHKPIQRFPFQRTKAF